MAGLFEPHKVPFSVRGSFLCISWLARDQSFWIRNLRGGDEHTDDGRLFRIVTGGDALLAPECLTLGEAEILFEDADTIRLRTAGLGLTLAMPQGKYNFVHRQGDGCITRIARQDLGCAMAVISGGFDIDSGWDGLSAAETTFRVAPSTEIQLRFFRVAPRRTRPIAFDAVRQRSARQFNTFLKRTLPGTQTHDEARRLAAYILWSGTVPAEGELRRPAIYMSKNAMNNIWSWDHCFTALALGKLQPAKAFEQMAVVFDHQHASGRLPDFINDRFAYWSFTKPPVHGWAFSKLRDAAPQFYTKPILKQVVAWLERQAASWLAAPRLIGLPTYAHGNDGGWDNSTMFLKGTPVACPDLAAFLILQYDEIAALHTKLGNRSAASSATAKANRLMTALLKGLWTDGHFTARLMVDGSVVRGGHSLQGYMPLLLGLRLPDAIRQALLQGLFAEETFLTKHGFATEAMHSAFYRTDGYWRGPIWAPTTFLLFDALERCGEAAKARDIAGKFCVMAANSGMAENFNALTGEGLSDPAFAWTSAVFLLLSHSLHKNPY